ncbi:MAG TPA: Gfo/Idh/MocA family oxidoreductase [Cytophagaceae bacterium]|jgi:predicted dehydrogenase
MEESSVINRREMLNKLSLGTGLIALSSTAYGANLNLGQEKKLGVALVGLGNYSNLMLGPALQETRYCKLTSIVTGTPSKAEEWAKRYNIPKKNIYNYKSFDSIIDNKDIDIVYIVLPNFLHAEFTIRAAQAGKHVICEKPMAMNEAECIAMIEACDKAKRKLSIGYRLHFEAYHNEIKRLHNERAFGSVNFIESSFGFSMADPTTWRLDKDKGGGGAIMDLGIYVVNGIRNLLKEDPIAVTAQATTARKDLFKGIHETITWQMEFPSRVVTNCTTTYSSYIDRLYISAEKGWMQLNPSYNAGGPKGETSNGPINFPAVKHQQILQIDDFAQCILNNSKSSVSGEEGLKDIKIISSIIRAAEIGEKVKIVL